MSWADSRVPCLVSGPCCAQGSSSRVEFHLLSVSLCHSTLRLRSGGGINSRAAPSGSSGSGKAARPVSVSRNPRGLRGRGEQVLGARRVRTEECTREQTHSESSSPLAAGQHLLRARLSARGWGGGPYPGPPGVPQPGGRGLLILVAPGSEAEMEFSPSCS